MKLVREDRLTEFAAKHADALKALSAWASTVRRSDWRNLMEIRKTYRHADGLIVASGKTVTIFNIKGNRYRLVTAIDYRLGVVNVLRLLTHSEYDKAGWKDVL